MAFLCGKDLDTENFISTVKNFSFPKDSLIMAFSPARACFEKFSFDETFLRATDQGRIFSPNSEFKWRRTDGRIRVVYLGNMLPSDKFDDFSSELGELTTEISQVILWGVRTDLENEWIEQQVPHRFNYPVSGKEFARGRVVLKVENWIDSAGLAMFSRYHSIKEIREIKAKPKFGTLPYSVQQIKIENFQCIKKTGIDELENDTRWVFLLGDNGAGKTALLQAIAIGICGTKNAITLLDDQKKARIYVSFKEEGQLKENNIQWRKNARAWEFVKRPNYFCAYGPSRLDIQGDRTVDQEMKDVDPETSLLNQRGNLLNIERWILGQEKIGRSDSKAKTRSKNVLKLLEKLLPSVSEIRMEKDYLEYLEKGFWGRIHQIASGPKSILAMVGDILIRLFEMQPDVTEPQKLKGIVVIDEIDVHMHPIYQSKLPNLLSTSFPLVQFICSTHSPIPMLGAPKESQFFVVERDESNGTIVRDTGVDVSRLHPNALLTSPLFKLEALFSKALNGYANLDPEDDYYEIEERKELEKRIRKSAQKGYMIPKDWFEG